MKPEDRRVISLVSPEFNAKCDSFKLSPEQAEIILYSRVNRHSDKGIIEVMKAKTSDGFFGYAGIVDDCHFFGLIQKGEYKSEQARFAGYYINGFNGAVEFRSGR